MTFRKRWERGWEWKVGHWFFLLNFSSINGPHLRWDWYDNTHGGFYLEWGNGNSDPVWAIGFSFTPSLWLGRLIDRIWR